MPSWAKWLLTPTILIKFHSHFVGKSCNVCRIWECDLNYLSNPGLCDSHQSAQRRPTFPLAVSGFQGCNEDFGWNTAAPPLHYMNCLSLYLQNHVFWNVICVLSCTLQPRFASENAPIPFTIWYTLPFEISVTITTLHLLIIIIHKCSGTEFSLPLFVFNTVFWITYGFCCYSTAGLFLLLAVLCFQPQKVTA